MTDSKERNREADAPAPPSRAFETGEIDPYPRMVFRPGHQVRVWNRYDVDTLIVGSMAALRDALEHGWFLDPSDMDPEATPKEKIEAAEKEERRGTKESGMNKRGKQIEEDRKERPETDPNSIHYDPYKDPANPRPGEPDNAPLRNTTYENPQTGDLADPPKEKIEAAEKEERRGTKESGMNKRGKQIEEDRRERPETDPNSIHYDPYKDPANPRPGEPDNAPLRNTTYENPQTGDLADPPTSPAEPPRQTPIPPEEATVPGQEPGRPDQGLPGDQPRPDQGLPDTGTPPAGGGAPEYERGTRVENDLPDPDKGLPGKPGGIIGGIKPPEPPSKGGAAGEAHKVKGETHTSHAKQGGHRDSDSLRDKGAPPGSKKG